MKHVLVLFYLISFASFSQTLQRQLYERYFKPLYTYEPAMVRENNIESLEVRSTQMQNDSVLFQGVKEKVNFRKDGRPERRITYTDFHRDSVITDYSYDSLGNLVEFRQWNYNTYYPHRNEQLEIQHLFFQYRGNQLLKVFSYYMRKENNYSTLEYCDSLSYSDEQKKLKIMHGNANASFILFDKTPKFIYPINQKNITEFTGKEVECASKPVDKECLWKVKCSYVNEELRKLQSLTGCQCIPVNVTNCFQRKEILEYGKPVSQQRDTTIGFSNNKSAVFIDTLEKRVDVKGISFISEPTSLENRNTTTESTSHYDFSFNLLRTEQIIESSRGQRENSRDSSETIYSYFEFGLMQRKQEFHYWSSVFRGYNVMDSQEAETWRQPLIILEELVTINTW